MSKRKRSLPWTPEMVREFELNILMDVSARLCKGAGAQGAGVTLTGPECAVLVNKFFKQPIRRDRRRRDYQTIALESLLSFDGVEAAVASTVRSFGVSRSTVFVARKKWSKYFPE